MAVPAHDTRDWAFARKHQLPIRLSIQNPAQDLALRPCPTLSRGRGIAVNSGEFTGLPSAEARRRMADFAARQGFGEAQVNYRLRDWLISRQRYWGAPIPIIYCEDCGMQTVPEQDLPVLLPEDVEFRPKGESLAGSKSFHNVKCPVCGKPARRESDTMGHLCGFQLAFPALLAADERRAIDTEACNRWLPVDQYIGRR